MEGMAADRSRSKRGSKVVAQAWVDDRLLMDTVHTELSIEIIELPGQQIFWELAAFSFARHWVPLINSKSLGHLRLLAGCEG